MSKPNPPLEPPVVAEVEAKRRTRRSFVRFGIAGAVGAGAWGWLVTRSNDGGIPWPWRKSHEFNEQLGRALFSPTRLAPEFPPAKAREPRPNGAHGRPEATLEPWTVSVTWPGSEQKLNREDLFSGVARTESTTELKCIEGWTQIVSWSGYRFSDVAKARGWPAEQFPYIAMSTADGDYYVGLDSPSALHPQTLLCDAMNGEPLPANHGGPVRLTIPVKYGIKNIKWLARIEFSKERPKDYWAERGYDWYSGH